MPTDAATVTQIRDAAHDGGDLGRRIRQRRQELGLSLLQVAGRAGMAADYLEYIENAPRAEPLPSALYRIALALEVAVEDLLGEQGRAHGWSPPASNPHLITIEERECGALLAPGGVGRLVFRTGERPIALPVNFKMSTGDVVFRSARNSEIGSIAPGVPVSFEVDRFDDTMSEGWSVLAGGTVECIEAPDQIAGASKLGIEPWVGDDRRAYFRLTVDSLTGRRIIAA